MNSQPAPVPKEEFAALPDAEVSVAAAEPSEKTRKSASAFRTISEVADDLNVQQHVLRFWETKFSQIRPLKRGGGRRYYRPEDVEVLRTIYNLLYTQGYTIKGVQKLFREQGKKGLVEKTPLEPRNNNAPPVQKAVAGLSDRHRAELQSLAAELRELRAMVSEGK